MQLIRLFEMGRYQEYCVRLEMAQAQEDMEETLRCAEEMTLGLGEMASFREAPLYEHIPFRQMSDESCAKMKERLDALFREEDNFGYMKGNERWERFLKEKEKR